MSWVIKKTASYCSYQFLRGKYFLQPLIAFNIVGQQADQHLGGWNRRNENGIGQVRQRSCLRHHSWDQYNIQTYFNLMNLKRDVF